MISKRNSYSTYVITFDAIIVWTVYLLTFANAATAVMSTQANNYYAGWYNLTLISRYMIVGICAVYIFFYYLQKIQINRFILSIYLFLIYICFVAATVYHPSIRTVLQGTFTWPLTYVVFYLYSLKYDLTPFFRVTVKFTYILLLLLLCRTIMLQEMEETNTGSVYYGVVYLPLLFMISKRKEMFLYYSAISIIVALSSKRAGVIALLAGFVIYYYCSSIIKSSFRERLKGNIALLFVAGGIFAIFYFFIENYNSELFNQFYSIPEDQGSGRLIIWKDILDYFQRSSMSRKLIGHGFYAVPNLVQPFNRPIYAHNSFVEFLYDMGIIGVVWLSLMVVAMLIYVFRLLRSKHEMAPVAAFTMVIVLVFSMVSYFFEMPSTIMMIAVCWGVITGKCFREKEESAL